MKCVRIDERITICLCTYSVDAFMFYLDDDYGGDDDHDDDNNNNNNNVISNENLPSSVTITFLKYGCLINDDSNHAMKSEVSTLPKQLPSLVAC
jgi:hypothetical protein